MKILERWFSPFHLLYMIFRGRSGPWLPVALTAMYPPVDKYEALLIKCDSCWLWFLAMRSFPLITLLCASTHPHSTLPRILSSHSNAMVHGTKSRSPLALLKKTPTSKAPRTVFNIVHNYYQLWQFAICTSETARFHYYTQNLYTSSVPLLFRCWSQYRLPSNTSTGIRAPTNAW